MDMCKISHRYFKIWVLAYQKLLNHLLNLICSIHFAHFSLLFATGSQLHLLVFARFCLFAVFLRSAHFPGRFYWVSEASCGSNQLLRVRFSQFFMIFPDYATDKQSHKATHRHTLMLMLDKTRLTSFSVAVSSIAIWLFLFRYSIS